MQYHALSLAEQVRVGKMGEGALCRFAQPPQRVLRAEGGEGGRAEQRPARLILFQSPFAPPPPPALSPTPHPPLSFPHSGRRRRPCPGLRRPPTRPPGRVPQTHPRAHALPALPLARAPAPPARPAVESGCSGDHPAVGALYHAAAPGCCPRADAARLANAARPHPGVHPAPLPPRHRLAQLRVFVDGADDGRPQPPRRAGRAVRARGRPRGGGGWRRPPGCHHRHGARAGGAGLAAGCARGWQGARVPRPPAALVCAAVGCRPSRPPEKAGPRPGDWHARPRLLRGRAPSHRRGGGRCYAPDVVRRRRRRPPALKPPRPRHLLHLLDPGRRLWRPASCRHRVQRGRGQAE